MTKYLPFLLFSFLFSVLHTAINTASPVLSPEETSLNNCIEQHNEC